MLVEHLTDRLLRDEADDAVDGLAALEEDEARDPGDAVLPGDRGVLVGVHLHEADPVAELTGDLLDDGREHAARAAPGGPKIDQDGLVGAQHGGREGALGDVEECAHYECFDPAAGATVSTPGPSKGPGRALGSRDAHRSRPRRARPGGRRTAPAGAGDRARDRRRRGERAALDARRAVAQDTDRAYGIARFTVRNCATASPDRPLHCWRRSPSCCAPRGCTKATSRH